jgi:hypothetical protein
MAFLKNSPGFQIDGRVSIALDALDDQQKQAVSGVISDRDHFLASVANSRRVRRISKDQSLYTLNVPSGLRIIYSKVGDDIVIMDLMMQATLDFFGQKKTKAKPVGTGTKKVRARSHAKKTK